MWQFIGNHRPDFAQRPRPGQESVWDYPRPPSLEKDDRRIIVRLEDVIVADTQRALRLLETASPPTFYLPPDDIRCEFLVPESGRSFCEWKGQASYFSVLLPSGRRVETAAWNYPSPRAAFAAAAGWFAFYPGRIRCEIAGERVRAQTGGFYGGWITDEIVGPFKGDTGTGGW